MANMANMDAIQNTKCQPEFDQSKSTAAFYPDESDKKITKQYFYLHHSAVFVLILISVCIM